MEIPLTARQGTAAVFDIPTCVDAVPHPHQNLQQQALQLSKARDEDTLDRMFKIWHVQELGSLLVRTRELRAQRSAIAAWRTRLALIRQHWHGN